ncbi:MAG: glycoside hydrolase family 2 TIM barrel-domain containing protein [Phycisphaerae bacterium]
MARRAGHSEWPHVSPLFDRDWRFHKGDVAGGEAPGLADAAWQRVDVPHDWSIEGPFDPKNPSGGAGAFLPGGVGWYRKHFTISEVGQKHVFITFDGVMANSDVWVNGVHLGHRPYGYVTFGYELTPHLRNGENVVAVRADTSQQPASRWYAGSGIYRHVHLYTTDAVHFVRDGLFVTTPDLQPGAERATVHVQSEVVNQSDVPRQVSVHLRLVAPDGRPIEGGDSAPQVIGPGATGVFEQDVAVAPRWWDLEHPQLYRAETEIRGDGQVSDGASTEFGIRAAEFSPTEGFVLNGKSVKLKGVCLHGDFGGLGVAVPVAAWEHRLSALKGLGVNAIRTAHNPPAPEFLDLCDRMGFLVMDEMFDCWLVGKTRYDYHLYFKEWHLTDTRDTVRRDRNHPSIVLYSAGNEIHDTPNAQSAIPILRGLVEVFHENDPTRPVTQALFRPNVSHDYTDGLADLLDVVGTNYRDDELLAAQRDKPSRKIVNTESGPALKAWAAVRDHPSYSGQFLWTGADYLGESRRWPVVLHESGLIDITDTPRGIGYQRQSWWSEKPMVAMVRDQGAVANPSLPGEPQTRAVQALDWTPSILSPHKERVLVYSNCEEVELFLNGKSLGARAAPKDESPRRWEVDFAPGTLKAVGRNGGREAAESELQTAGKPAKVVLMCDRKAVGSNWDDLAFVTARVVDEAGIQVPSADNRITFSITGPGAIVAVENADPAAHDPYQANAYPVYIGRCLAMVRGSSGGSGPFTITARADGLAAGTLQLKNQDR